MTFRNVFLAALNGLLSNKLRAGLTALGIIIGVASVIAMLALGNGARAAVEASFQFLGADQIQISKKFFFEDEKKEAVKPLTYEEGLNLPANAPLIKRVEMSVGASGRVRHQRIVLDLNISGVTADAIESMHSQGQVQPIHWPDGEPVTAESFIGEGRFFTPAEVMANADVCVLGYQTAEDLFEGNIALGESIWINRRPYEVIGILTEMEMIDPQERKRHRPNDALFLPIGSAIENLFEEQNEPSVFITAIVSDPAKMEEAKQQVINYLRQQHEITPDEEGEYQDDFTLATKKDILGAQQEAAGTFSILLAAMAAVSLVVGGIGIMNVMLISVTERTREIGVRMAVGARQKDIVFQFLLESVLLSVAGGLAGILAGVLVIPLAASLNNGIALLAPSSIPLSLSMALLTGIVFGIYPALQASRLSPIESLRYE